MPRGLSYQHPSFRSFLTSHGPIGFDHRAPSSIVLYTGRSMGRPTHGCHTYRRARRGPLQQRECLGRSREPDDARAGTRERSRRYCSTSTTVCLQRLPAPLTPPSAPSWPTRRALRWALPY